MSALPSWAKNKPADKINDLLFQEEKIYRKGISLSEQGLLGNKKLRIRHTDSIRYDANYIPTGTLDGGKLFNLPIDQVQEFSVFQQELNTTITDPYPID